ncbi:NUDIX domain-containing protein [Eisenbergiella porci]|uniref:NUDIX domain-containing protein n=1 Tax=Eisenbergiella porci TaxID=2652274 RepID=UPI002A83E4D3|nr:NUDIX domain-containing protein [Eisenbergiella porci]
MDGSWDFAGNGQVDENESAKQAVARECQEELGIIWNMKIFILHTSHIVSD